MEPWGDQHGHFDTNWSPLGDQNGSTGVVKMESLGDQHGRVDTNWSSLVDQIGSIGVNQNRTLEVTNMAAWMQTRARWVIKMYQKWNPWVANTAAWIQTVAPWVTKMDPIG